MIYIISQSRDFKILEKELKEKNKEFSYISPNKDELYDLVESKKYEALFLSNEYKEYIKEKPDCIYIKNNEIIYKDLLYLAFKKFLEDNEINMNNKSILILGSEKNARIIYKILKEMYETKIFIASITEDTMKLEVGDRRIKKVEIFNLKKVDLIINTTILGSIGTKHTSMLEGNNFIKASNVIDLVYNPEYTSLLLKYKQKGSKVYSGLEIEKNKYKIGLDLI